MYLIALCVDLDKIQNLLLDCHCILAHGICCSLCQGDCYKATVTNYISLWIEVV